MSGFEKILELAKPVFNAFQPVKPYYEGAQERLAPYKKAIAAGLALSGAFYFVLKYPERYCYVGFENTECPQGQVDSITSTLQSGASVEPSVLFPSGKVNCVGDVYIPDLSKASPFRDANGKVPAIVMGHGIGATRDMGMYKFAEYFANRGILVLAFDYRRFGQSEGTPRQLLHPQSLADDFISAVEYVKTRAEVDSKRVCIWGTSYGGGHVVTAAGQLSEAGKAATIRCVISQVPFLGPIASESKLEEMRKRGWAKVSKLVLAATSGLIRPYFGLDDLYIGLYGHCDAETGKPTDDVLSLSYWEQMGESEDEWLSKHLKRRPNDWANGCLAAGLFKMLTYRPIDYVAKISEDIPVLFLAATKDTLCPTQRVVYASETVANGELFTVDAKHFEFYQGETLQTALNAQLVFLRKHLSVSE